MSAMRIVSIMDNGDCALLVTFAESADLLAGIHALCVEFIQAPLTNMINVIPATDNLTLVFSCQIQHNQRLLDEIRARCEQVQVKPHQVKTHEIPVCYHPAVAADLLHVCKQLNVEVAQVIAWHTEPTYLVAMLGFLPGFAYLNGNHDALQLPRKATPAIQVPAGSVAVAGKQTGVYALSSPGGWQVLGRTSMPMLDWSSESQPMRLNPLDQVRFTAISLAQYNASNDKQ